MTSHHRERREADIRRELTAVLRTLKDPRIGPMLSVVKTELSGDGAFCRVHVSSLAGKEAAAASCAGLRSAAGFIRREIGRRVRLRVTPEFVFIPDDSIERGVRIQEILNGLGRDRPPETEKERKE